MSQMKHLRLAVVQMIVHLDPGDAASLRDSGNQIRYLMRAAHRSGARLIQFPEGATSSPHKKVMSVDGPEKVGPANWDRVDWAVLTEELTATAELAGELRLWTVLGSAHRLTPPHRPHNSMYVISDAGEIVTRYDERMLSKTKIAYMYTPGAAPVTFEVDGLRFGCALGMEATFPEVFLEYESLDVDCVLFSTHGPGTAENNGPFAQQSQAHAAANSYWVSYCGTTQDASNAPSGVISPDGDWVGRCRPEATPTFVIVDLHGDTDNFARPWRRTARSGIYDRHQVPQDPRSQNRSAF